MSNSVRPQRRQPTRPRHPWDSPGNKTRVGCHFLLQCMKVKCESEVAQSCPTPSDPMDYSLPGSSIHGIFQARLLEWVAIAFSGNWRLTILKRVLIRPPHDQFQDDCQSWLCCFCTEPPPSACKSSWLLIVSCGSWPLDRCPSVSPT